MFAICMKCGQEKYVLNGICLDCFHLEKTKKVISDEEVDQIVDKDQLSNDDIEDLCDWVEDQKKNLEE